MYDSLFPDQTQNVLGVELPPTKPRSPGIFAGMGRALAAIPKVAVAETARALEGFQQTAAPSLSAVVDAPRMEAKNAGVDYPSFSESVGRDIKRFTPDPAVTGEASQIVFGVGKVLAKAIPLGMMGGLPAAAIGTGAIEGTTEAQRLGDEGVDPLTAAKVGAVRAVTTAVGIAAPIAGKTLAQTAGLVIAGGPASFMVEQQASKMILDAADYGKIAAQYDPFDPVGLTIATLIPAVVGGAAHGLRVRGARAEAKAKEAAAALAKEGIDSTPEAQAAARVVQTAEHVQDTALYRPGTAVDLNAHVDALELAKRQLDAGEEVSVGGVLRQVMDEEAASAAAEKKPGFLRTADDLVALRQKEYPYLTPELARAIEIARTPGAFRSAEDRIFVKGLLEEESGPAPKRELPPQPAQEARSAEPVARRAAVPPEPAAAAVRQDSAVAGAEKAPDPIEASAREVARIAPDMQIVDELTGQKTTASQMLHDAEAVYQKDTRDSGAFMAAITCFVGR